MALEQGSSRLRGYQKEGAMAIAQLEEQAVTGVLAGYGSHYELLPHRHTETARAEARALGIEPEEVAKTVVVRTADGYIRAVLPASKRLDLAKLRAVLRTNGEMRLATEAELAAAYPEFELGAVPPIGGPEGDTVVVDVRLTRHVRLAFDAGTHEESVRLTTDHLLALTDAHVVDVCEA